MRLRRDKNLSLTQIVERTGVSVAKVRYYLKRDEARSADTQPSQETTVLTNVNRDCTSEGEA